MKRRILFAMVLFEFALCATAQKVTAVRFQKLCDGERVIDGALVLIENGRIRSVTGGNPSPPAGAEIIDGSRYYGLPGLIDMHTHMTYYWTARPVRFRASSRWCSAWRPRRCSWRRKTRRRLWKRECPQCAIWVRRTTTQAQAYLSDEHFTVDGTLIEAWASQKSFQNTCYSPALSIRRGMPLV